MKFIRILPVAISLLTFTSLLTSQTPVRPPAPDHWWKMSALSARDSLNRLLFHAEGTLSYNNTTGNFEARMLQSSADVAVRQGTVTGSLNYRYSNQRTKDGNQETFREYLLAGAEVTWDLTPFLTSKAGVLWEKDEQRLMLNQYLPYVGLGTRWSITPEHQLNLFIAGGRAYPTYTIPVAYFGMKEGAYNGAHFSEYYKFSNMRGLGFEQEVVHLRNLNETKRYSTTFSVRISFALSQHLEVLAGYTRSFNTEAGFVGANQVDAMQSVGIRLSI